MIFPIKLDSSAESSVVTAVEQFLRESTADPRRQPAMDAGTRGMQVVSGEHFSGDRPAEMQRITVDRTSPAVDQSVSAEMSDPPTVEFSRLEEGDPADTYIDVMKLPGGKEGVLTAWAAWAQKQQEFQQSAAVLAATGVPSVANGPEPETEAEQVVVALQNAGVKLDNLAPFTGDDGQTYKPNPIKESQWQMLPDLLKAALVHVDDQRCANVQQKLYEAKMKEAGAEPVLLECVRLKKTVGWQDTMLEWDADRQVPVFTNLFHKQSYPDPTAGPLMARNQMYFYEEILDLAHACAKYPKWRKWIQEYPDWYGVEPKQFSYSEEAAIFQTILFRRGMVRILHGWLRNVPIEYMSEEEAVAKGLVEREEIEEPIPEDEAPPASPTEPTQIQPSLADAPEAVREPSGDTVVPLAQITIAAVVKPTTRTRVVYRMPALPTDPPGEEVKPGEEGWPCRLGIRHLMIVHKRVVLYEECEWPEFPVASNKNMPIPNSFYGKGLPQLLEGPQNIINWTATDITNLIDHLGFPAVSMSESAKVALEKLGQKITTLFSMVGKILIFEDKEYAKLPNGQAVSVQQGPGLQNLPAMMSWLGQARDMCDLQGSNTRVMQGDAPGQSGRAIQQLQAANRTAMTPQAIETEHWLIHLAHLVRHALLYKMSTRDWMRYVGGYPEPIMEAIRSRCMRSGWAITAISAAGTGQKRLVDQQNAIVMMQQGIISMETCRERLNINDSVERERIAKERGMQGVPGGMQPGMPPQGAGGQVPPQAAPEVPMAA